MTKPAVKSLLKHITYKSGFKLSIDKDSGDIEVLLMAPNAYDTGFAEARAYVVYEKYRHASVKQTVRLIADAIWRLENHEYMEWLKYRGRRLYAPHG